MRRPKKRSTTTRLAKKRVTSARGVTKYTKRYANAGRRKKVAYEHGINREKNLLTNPTGLQRMRQTLC